MLDLKNLVTLFIDVGTWSGTGRIDPKDLGIPESVIPPKEIASLGTIRLIDKEHLHQFDNIRKATHRACRLYGVQFLGGYAVPSYRAADLKTELDELRKKYLEARGKLLTEYEEATKEFAANHPQYAEVILAKVPRRQYLERQLRFVVNAAKVSNASEVQSLFDNTTSSLWRVLLEEVACDASRAYDESFCGRVEVTQRALRPLRALAEKLDGMQILNRNVQKVALYVHSVIDGLPKTGKIGGRDLAAAQGLLLTLSTVEQIEQAINGFEADDPGTDNGGPMAPPQGGAASLEPAGTAAPEPPPTPPEPPRTGSPKPTAWF